MPSHLSSLPAPYHSEPLCGEESRTSGVVTHRFAQGIMMRHMNSFILIFISLLLFGCTLREPSEAATNSTVTLEPIFTSTPAVIRYSGEGNLVFLSIEENGYAHLFVQSNPPQELPLTRITTGEWNDIAPALSPDRKQLAFASDRNGYWDLYVM